MTKVFNNRITLYGSGTMEELANKVVLAHEKYDIGQAVRVFCWNCANAPRRKQQYIKRGYKSGCRALPATDDFKAKRKEFRKVVESFFNLIGYDAKAAGQAYFKLKGYYGLRN